MAQVAPEPQPEHEREIKDESQPAVEPSAWGAIFALEQTCFASCYERCCGSCCSRCCGSVPWSTLASWIAFETCQATILSGFDQIDGAFAGVNISEIRSLTFIGLCQLCSILGLPVPLPLTPNPNPNPDPNPKP